MVKVTYDRRSHAVFLRGHADSAEKGRDLVCAAVSILAYTLGAFVLGMKEAKAAECVCVDLLSGDVNWPEVMKAFHDIGYEGWAAGEMIPQYTHASDQIIYNTSASMERILNEKF